MYKTFFKCLKSFKVDIRYNKIGQKCETSMMVLLSGAYKAFPSFIKYSSFI